MSKKICKKCDKKKQVEEFGKDSKQPDGIGVWCKQCAREYRDSRRSVSTGTKTKVSKSKPRKNIVVTNKFYIGSESESSAPSTDSVERFNDALKPTSTKSIKKKKIEIEDDDSYDLSKAKQKYKIDYLVSIQNHGIKGSFAIRTNYKPEKLIKSVRSIVTRQLQMLGIPDCEIIEIFKPQIVK